MPSNGSSYAVGRFPAKGVFLVKKAYVRILAVVSSLAAIVLAGGANTAWH